jgi:hypothetical protein
MKIIVSGATALFAMSFLSRSCDARFMAQSWWADAVLVSGALRFFFILQRLVRQGERPGTILAPPANSLNSDRTRQ